jgi:hypothetical protein
MPAAPTSKFRRSSGTGIVAPQQKVLPDAALPEPAHMDTRSGHHPVEIQGLESRACNLVLAARHRVGHIEPYRRCGRVAEGGGLLNRYRVVKPYRGFESLRLRQPSLKPQAKEGR